MITIYLYGITYSLYMASFWSPPISQLSWTNCQLLPPAVMSQLPCIHFLKPNICLTTCTCMSCHNFVLKPTLASFPSLPRFCSLVCVRYNTRKSKNKNGGGLGMRLGLPYFIVVVTVVHGVGLYCCQREQKNSGTRLWSDLIIFTGGVACFWLVNASVPNA